MKEPTLLVLGPNGHINQTGGPCPREWLGKHLGHAVGLPPEVFEAASELIEAARTGAAWLDRRFVETPTKTYEVMVVAAVPLRRSAINVRDILTRTTELLLEQARAIEVSLHVTSDPEMPAQLVVDGEKIAWGVATLVGSALRHLSRETSRERAKGSVRVQARYLAESEEVVIVVRDNGPGIPSERLLGILTPATDAAHSSALALIMLQDVVAAHGGRLELESSIERATHGTMVSLFLPARSVTALEASRSS